MSNSVTRSARLVATATGVVLAVAGLMLAGANSAQAATVTTYDALVAAFSAGGTVTLGANIYSPHENLVVGTKPVTLDPNGHNLVIGQAYDPHQDPAPTGLPNGVAAINVGPGRALTIDDGTAPGGYVVLYGGGQYQGGPGIGGDFGDRSGSITIAAGNVEAYGSSAYDSFADTAGLGGAGARVSLTGGVTDTNGVSAPGGSSTVTGGALSSTLGFIAGRVRIDAAGVVNVRYLTIGAEDSDSFSNAGHLTVEVSMDIPAGATGDNSGLLSVIPNYGTPLTGAGTLHNTGTLVVRAGATVEDDGQGPTGSALLVTSHNYSLTLGESGAPSGTANPLRIYAPTVDQAGRALRTPTKPGYRFLGWFTARSGGTRVLNTTALEPLFGAGPVAVTLYAQYQRLPVSAVTPLSGPTSGGATVTITGTEFTGASAVRFGGVAAKSFQVVSPSKITAVTPAHAEGRVDVTVTSAGATTSTATTDYYSYRARPVITSVTPSRGTSNGGQRITITGTDLVGASAVGFSTTAAKSFRVDSSTQITAVSPARPGVHGDVVVNIYVTTVGGTNAPTAGDRFTYHPPAG